MVTTNEITWAGPTASDQLSERPVADSDGGSEALTTTDAPAALADQVVSPAFADGTTIGIAVFDEPATCRLERREQRARRFVVATPSPCLGKRDDPEWRGVDTAVVQRRQ